MKNLISQENNLTKRNRIAGAIYGFAIGDAMGASTEFMSKEKIKLVYQNGVKDIIGGGWLNLKVGEVTDDTQMSMCVMNAFMKTYHKQNCFYDNFTNALRKEFVKWFNSNPKDVGMQCRLAISYIMKNHMYAKSDEEALGNGSLMRAMPMALVNNLTLNIVQGKMTHNNNACSLTIQKYHEMMQRILNGNYSLNRSYGLKNPSGHIFNTFNNAVYWSSLGSFEDAIVGAVNDGGDSDTIAAITGSLAGAKFGYNNIPSRWVNQLDSNVKITLEKFKNFTFSYLHI